MKILTIVYSIGPGGTERAAVNYAVAYKRAGCDSRVWVLGDGHDRKYKLDNEQVITYFDKLDKQHESNAKDIGSWQPDIIHIHTLDSKLLNLIVPLKLKGAKVVESNVFSRPRYNKLQQLVDISFQLAYWGVWKYGKWMRDEKLKPINLMLPYLIFESDFIINIHANENRDRLCKQLNIPSSAFIAARVGQAHTSKWDKRIFTVVKKSVELNSNIYFIFVGLPEKFLKELESLPHHVKNNIRTLSVIENDVSLNRFYSSIDVFVHISKIGESFGYVLIEAMSCGCPVITLNTPLKDNAQCEVVENTKGGYCVNTINEFIEKLLVISLGKIDFDKNILQHHVFSRFSESIITKKILAIYELLINNKLVALKNMEMVDLRIAQTKVTAQVNMYGFKSFFIKNILKIMHLPFFYKFVIRLRS